MTYVYDILLNFHRDFFDFFEWESNDEILHIKKIPIFRIPSHDFYLFKNSLVRFDKEFIDKVFNKTEKFSRRKNTISYAFLVSNGHEIMALKLNKNGVNVYKSSLILDEEDDVLDTVFNIRESSIGYSVLKKEDDVCFKTRREKKIEKYINDSIDLLYKNKENDKLQYLYLDCFNIKENDIKKIYEVLKKEIIVGSKNIEKMNVFFKIIEQK